MLVIFDWDGTLCDSTEKIVVCMQRAADELDIIIPDRGAVLNIIGLSLEHALERLYPDMGQHDAGLLKAAYSKHFIEDSSFPASWYDGAEELLDCLRSQGHTLAIATGKSRRGLERNLRQMQAESLFDGSRCADETVSKPDPLMLSQLLQQFDTLPHNAFMIGDTTYDMEMAQRADIKRIAVSHGAHHIDRLRAFDPILCVDHLPEMTQWFLALESND